MAVPSNDLKRRYAAQRDVLLADIAGLIDGGIYIGGEPVKAFEQEFAAHCGAPFCIALANGTDALEFSLRACGVGTGDEVICIANAGGYATVAILAAGASPVYAEIDPATCQLDLSALPAALSEKTKAVIVTHLYGVMNDVEAVREILAKNGRSDIRIVEDCAQSHGAAIRGRRAGSLGDVASFSFYPTKNLGALGDAGAVTCLDADVAATLVSLRQYGWSTKYVVDRSGGHNSRLDPLQALVLRRQLVLLDEANARRRAICERYVRALPQGWSLAHAPGEAFVGHLAVALAPDAAARERMRVHLNERGIGTDVHYPILDCDQRGWQGAGRSAGDLAHSRHRTQTILSLPCFPELTEAEIAEVENALHDFR